MATAWPGWIQGKEALGKAWDLPNAPPDFLHSFGAGQIRVRGMGVRDYLMPMSMGGTHKEREGWCPFSFTLD